MKIMWITNIPIGKMYETIFQKPSHGLWMDALLNDFQKANEHRLVIVTVRDHPSIQTLNDGQVSYYLLPKYHKKKYDYSSKKCLHDWETLLKAEMPDIIQVWGTEQSFGLCALSATNAIPGVVYMQGVIKLIARYYTAGMTRNELRQAIALRDWFFNDRISQQKGHFASQALIERETLKKAGNAICENDWCAAHISEIAPGIAVHRCPLTIDQSFYHIRWEPHQVEPYAIMCGACEYPLKGLHMLIKAVALLKNDYPEIKLYVPGMPLYNGKSILKRLKNRGYYRFIARLMVDLQLDSQVIFCGKMNASQMAEKMAKAHVFVMCSAVENHSSTLKEAMAVGTPCIASYVGGIPEYIVHNNNGLLYRFEEFEMLATHIRTLFETPNLAKTLSVNARSMMDPSGAGAAAYEQITGIYQSILEKNRC